MVMLVTENELLSAAVTPDGDLTFTRENGDVINAGSLLGPEGPQGVPGLDGSNVLPTSEAIEQAITQPGPAKDALSATIAEAARARDVELKSTDFASIADLFDAANAVGGPVIIRLAPIDHGKVPPLTIAHSHTTLDGYGATLTLEDGAAGPLLTVAPDAQQVNIFGVRLDGNATEQTAERHLLYFAPYSGAARPADRSNVTRVELV